MLQRYCLWLSLLFLAITDSYSQTFINIFPYEQSFDGTDFIPDDSSFNAGAPIIFMGGGWVNDQNDDPQDWAIRSLPTGSSSTGPSAHLGLGPGNYVYIEDGFGNYDTINLLSPLFDISQLLCPKLSFWYHHQSSTSIGNLLHLDVMVGATWVLDIIPAIENKGDGNWHLFTVDMSTWADTIQVRFRADNSLTGFQNDIALDDFRIFDADNRDMALIQLFTPESGCELGKEESISIGVLNLGCSVAQQIPVSLLQNGQVVSQEIIPGPVESGDTLLYTFNTKQDLSQTGNYEIAAILQVSGDQININDTLEAFLVHFPIPNMPQVYSDTICEYESASLSAQANDALILWYDSLQAGNLLAIGDSVEVPFQDRHTHYYAAAGQKQVDSVSTFTSGAFMGTANFIDLTSEVGIMLDSIGIQVATYDSIYVDIFIKKGSYLGFETDSSAWTHYSHVQLKANGAKTITTLPIQGIGLKPAETMSMLIQSSSPLGSSNGSYIYSNGYLEIETGPGVNALWSSTLFANRAWNGSIYFSRSVCESARKKASIYLPLSATTDFGLPDSIAHCQGNMKVLEAGVGMNYAWNNGSNDSVQTITTSGLYKVVKTNESGCESSDSVQVEVFPEIAILLADLVHPQCEGDSSGSISMAVSGGSPPFLSWWNTGDTSLQISGLSEGLYNFQVEDSVGCHKAFPVIPLIPWDSIPRSSFSFAQNGNAFNFLNQSRHGESFTWDFGDGSPLNTDFNPSHTFLTTGIFTVVLIASNSCGEDTSLLQIEVGSVGLAESAWGNQISLFPNPGGHSFQLYVNHNQLDFVEVSITDEIGRQVYLASISLDKADVRIPIQLPKNLASGIYYVRISNERKSVVKKYQLQKEE